MADGLRAQLTGPTARIYSAPPALIPQKETAREFLPGPFLPPIDAAKLAAAPCWMSA